LTERKTYSDWTENDETAHFLQQDTLPSEMLHVSLWTAREKQLLLFNIKFRL